MITPRRTRLVRVPDLRTFRAAIRGLIADCPAPPVVVVPTRSAAQQLGTAAFAVTRDELYELLRGSLSEPPRLLTPMERDAIARASSRAAADATEVTFRLRPGLVAEMLRFYDHLRRQSQSVQRFEQLIQNAIGGDDFDIGARRMRQQTRFLAAAFRAYEQRVRDSAACDEHLLRERLMQTRAQNPVRRLVVTVADWIADPDGLFVADFDLLARIPDLAALDIVATEAILASGFHERLHGWLPGLEEDDRTGRHERTAPATRFGGPVLVTATGAGPDSPWWTHRDREEELVAIARQIRADRRSNDSVGLDRIAVVFKKPLPYLYLARDVFGSAGIPYRAYDAFPLAAEPAAAALDLVLDAADADCTRDTLVALLRSPHFTFDRADRVVSRASIGALDRALSKARYLGDPARLSEIGDAGVGSGAAPAYCAAIDASAELTALREPATASAKLRHLLAFWKSHLRPLDDPDGLVEPGTARSGRAREHHARSAITQTLSALAAVHEAHDDPLWTLDDLMQAVRRAIEEQTFGVAPAQPLYGIDLLDDRAVPYGEFDDIHVVGLVDQDWPERPRRNIFYPPALLKSLGWPSEKDRRAAADARFLDLVRAAARRTTLSVFTLEDDALVSRSMQLDEVPRARLSMMVREPDVPSRIFVDEALSMEPVAWQQLGGRTREWAALRVARSIADDPHFHGTTGPRPPRTWSVSAIETYIGCPFRFFAKHVLGLEEEPTDEEVMDPRRQGQFVHGVFERFFSAWQNAGYGAITQSNLDEARDMFGEVVEQCLTELPETEAGLERTRLLGSPAAAGLGEAVIRMEAERAVPVVERLLEYKLEGEFTFSPTGGPSRQVRVKGKADRLDLLADGTFRLIDYKVGWPPDRRKALQLPIYSLSAEQRLRGYRGRTWTLNEALYLAFKGPRRVVALFQDPFEGARVLAEAQDRLTAAIDAIARGQFPPAPDDVYRCETCSYSAVCRKDYVGNV